MKKIRDAEATKTKVLKVAEKIFADKGYSGTSLAMISQKSGFSDGLILYHFKTKENLYKQVVEKISAQYLKAVTGSLDKDLPVEEAMKESLIAAFEFWKKDTTCQRINLWAYLENREGTSYNEAQLTAKLTTYMLSLQEKGYFPKDIHPIVFLTMIIGSIQFWFRYKSRFSKILQLKKSEDELDDLFLKQFAQMIGKILPGI